MLSSIMYFDGIGFPDKNGSFVSSKLLFEMEKIYEENDIAHMEKTIDVMERISNSVNVFLGKILPITPSIFL